MLAEAIGDALREAKGSHRRDPVTARTGGPAGNAVLTAWTGARPAGAVKLAELVTLLDLSGLISWHVVIGIVLVPVALLKTATTGLRIIRYYLGDRLYRRAGPPPLLLRLLGPLVVLFTVALLGSGVLMVAVGPQTARQGFVTVVGHPLSLVSVHAGLAVCWAVVTGLHVLGQTRIGSPDRGLALAVGGSGAPGGAGPGGCRPRRDPGGHRAARGSGDHPGGPGERGLEAGRPSSGRRSSRRRHSLTPPRRGGSAARPMDAPAGVSAALILVLDPAGTVALRASTGRGSDKPARDGLDHGHGGRFVRPTARAAARTTCG